MRTKVMFALCASDVLFALACAVLLCAGLPGVAFAYVDPSVMTYTIQAVAGVAVALSAVVGVAWRRARKVIFARLGIDENANKVVEPDVHRVDPTAPRVPDSERAAKLQALASAGSRPAKPLLWKGRALRAAAASASLVFTVFVAAPYEIVASNAADLVFGLSQVWLPVAACALCVAVGLAALLTCLRGRAFDVAVGVVVALGVAAWAQAMFMNASLPPADGSDVNWLDHAGSMALSLAVWAALMAAAAVLACKKTRVFRSGALMVCAGLLVVQAVGVGSLFVSPQDASKAAGPEVMVTEQGLLEVAPEYNVVVFVLDTFDTAIAEELLAQSPELFDDLTGFTLFEDSTGSMVPTRYAVPYLLTGELPREGETVNDYVAARYERSTFMGDIAAAGYSIGIYSDSLGSEPASFAEDTMNIHSVADAHESMDFFGTAGMLFKCALYRDAPWVAKPALRFYTDEVNNAMLGQASAEKDAGARPYVMNDASYYDKLSMNGLSVEENPGSGAFRFIHLQGSHYPYTMDEHARAVPEGETSQLQQSAGSIEIVSEYVRQLKQRGLYEDATIIVTADHGLWYSTPDVIGEATSPLMLVKPAGDAALCAAPMQISEAPVSHLDFQATVVDAMGGDASAWGQTVWQASAPRERFYYMTANNGWDDLAVKEFSINGNALDFDNWQLTGRQWENLPAQ